MCQSMPVCATVMAQVVVQMVVHVQRTKEREDEQPKIRPIDNRRTQA